MMFVQATFGVLSGILLGVAGPPYVMDTIRGVTKPERTTWFIFSLLGATAFVSQLSLGAHWSLVFSGLDMLGSLAVFGLSIKYGTNGFTKLDIFALTIAVLGIILSIAAKQPLIAILGVIIADTAGTSLTLRKVYLEPSSETAISWFCIGTSAVCSVIAVGKWDLSLMVLPVYLAVANYGVNIAQLVGKAKLRNFASHKH